MRVADGRSCRRVACEQVNERADSLQFKPLNPSSARVFISCNYNKYFIGSLRFILAQQQQQQQQQQQPGQISATITFCVASFLELLLPLFPLLDAV